MTRSKAFSWIVVGWVLLESASWLLAKFLDTYANKDNITAGLEYANLFLDYATSGFSIGFVAGAALFSAWDLPLLGKWLRKYHQRIRNKEADEN